jgi:hypothetical protein
MDRIKFTSYDGGLPSHPQAEKAGELLLGSAARPWSWELHFKPKFISVSPEKQILYGGSAKYPMVASATGSRSCRITLTDKDDPAIGCTFELPSTSVEDFDAAYGDWLQRREDARQRGTALQAAPPRIPVAARVAPSTPQAAPSGPKKKRKELSRAARISWAVLVVVVLVVVLVQVIISSSSGPSPKFQATATATQVFSSGSLGVAFNVQNIGKGSGAPTCTVTAAAAASEGGVNVVTLPSIGPGLWDYESTSADSVSISGGAASQVDINNGGVLITCT